MGIFPLLYAFYKITGCANPLEVRRRILWKQKRVTL